MKHQEPHRNRYAAKVRPPRSQAQAVKRAMVGHDAAFAHFKQRLANYHGRQR